MLSPLASWLTSVGATTWEIGQVPWKLGQISYAPWGLTLILAGLASSMVVNTLVTGLIVFKILKVFLGVKVTSIERQLGSNAGGTKLRHIIFVIIESGMALFAIQLVRVVLTGLVAQTPTSGATEIGLDLVIDMHEMLNVIISVVHSTFSVFTDNIYYLFRASPQQ
jgi:hypothetical protein